MYFQSKQSLILCFTLNIVYKIYGIQCASLAVVLGFRLGLKMILEHMCTGML